MTTPARAGDRVVVVVGASSGIGEATALRFARRRVRLVLASRSEHDLQRVARACRRAGAREVLVHATDIADADQVQDLFDAAITRFQRVDVAAQCAAVTAFGRFEDVPVDVFEAVVCTNVLGAVNVARSALRHFQDTGAGQLVLVGSLPGTTAVPLQSAYVASKFAVSGLVRALRQENRHLPGVRVHGVYPGPVDTAVYGTAGNFSGLTPRVAPTALTPDSIAASIVAAAERRRSSERQVGWFNRPAIAAYRLMPMVFDALILPLLRRTSFTANATEYTPGNVLRTASADTHPSP